MAARILDHRRLCGSLDVYLVGDSAGWVVIDGVEMTEAHALEAVGGERYRTEAEAIAEFERRTDPSQPEPQAAP